MLACSTILQRLGACKEPRFTLEDLGSERNPLIQQRFLYRAQRRTRGESPHCLEECDLVDGELLCPEHGWVEVDERSRWFYQLDDQGIANALSNRIGESTAREASAGLWAIGNYNGQRLFYARRVTTAICSATHVDPTNALILTVRPPDITEVRWGNKILPLCEVFTLTPDMLNIQWSLLDRAAPPPKDVAPKPQTKQAKLALRVTRWHEFFCDRIDEIQRSKAKDNVSFDKPQPRDFRAWLKTKYPHEQCVSDRSLFKDLEKLQNPNDKLFYSQEIATLLANWNDEFLYKYNRQHIHDALTKRQATLQRDRRCSYDDNIHCG